MLGGLRDKSECVAPAQHAPRHSGPSRRRQTAAKPVYREGAQIKRREGAMSEGYTVEVADEIVGIIVRQDGERGYRFHSAKKEFDALDGMIFVKPAAAERAAAEFVRRGATVAPQIAPSSASGKKREHGALRCG